MSVQSGLAVGDDGIKTRYDPCLPYSVTLNAAGYFSLLRDCSRYARSTKFKP
jgi:hypothetical protein